MACRSAATTQLRAKVSAALLSNQWPRTASEPNTHASWARLAHVGVPGAISISEGVPRPGAARSQFQQRSFASVPEPRPEADDDRDAPMPDDDIPVDPIVEPDAMDGVHAQRQL